MTIKEYQAKLDKTLSELKTFSDPLRLAAFTTTAQMGSRIFDDGKKTDGDDIGKYSTKPIYVSMSAVPKPKGAPTGKPSGKTRKKKVAKFASDRGTAIEISTVEVAVGGKSKFKNGKPHKSKYFAEGYKGYRDNVGRQTDRVDLSLTGELRLDFGNQKRTAEPRKISDFEYQIQLNKDIDRKKRSGAEEKYGDIFTLTDQERTTFYDTLQFEFNNRISKIMGK